MLSVFFGEKLRELRKGAGFTQVELGEKVKVSGGAISQFEKGTAKPSNQTIKLLSKLLKFDFSQAEYGKPASDVQDPDMGSRLEQARKLKGYTQIELGDLVRVSRASIALYESGLGNPSVAVLKGLAIHLQVSLDWLVLGRRAEVMTSVAADLEERLQKAEAEIAAIRKEVADGTR